MEDSAAAIPITDRPDDATVQRTLTTHICAEVLRGAAASIAPILPFIAKLHFGASNTQIFLLTVAMPLMQFFTIYWHRVFKSLSTRAYLLLIATTMTAPLLLMSRMTTLNPIIALWLISAFGGAGGGGAMTPVMASILRGCYPDSLRGRAFGLIGAFRFGGVMIGGFLVGRWSEADHTAYQYYLPIAAILIGCSMMLYTRITPRRVAAGRLADAFSQWWKPITESVSVLKEDRNFREYEKAYMNYGVGWMICTVLLPLIGYKLGLKDEEFSVATVVALQAMMIVLLFPAGRIADRIGPVKLVSFAFLMLTLYPIMLAAAFSFGSLTAATLVYSIGMVGVHLGWTLGPVYFAPDSEQAPRYLAVHATLVGVRGLVFQGLGIFLYWLTGGTWIPLGIAALGFLLAAHQMRRLGARLAPPRTAIAK
ncbi:MAG: MFS transporter [Phycisphaerales bacterium]|nr:MFS transporter [Phycisphaerales bacterium]